METPRQKAKTDKRIPARQQEQQKEQQLHQPTRSRTSQDADTDKKTTKQNHAERKQAKYEPKADPRSKNLSDENKMTSEHGENNGREALKATIQTTEGIYEERLTSDNSNNCPIQQKMHRTRYIISEPPRMMRNVPKYYTAKKQV